MDSEFIFHSLPDSAVPLASADGENSSNPWKTKIRNPQFFVPGWLPCCPPDVFGSTRAWLQPYVPNMRRSRVWSLSARFYTTIHQFRRFYARFIWQPISKQQLNMGCFCPRICTNFHKSDLFIRVDSSDSWAILAVEPSLRSLRSFAVKILDAALPR